MAAVDQATSQYYGVGSQSGQGADTPPTGAPLMPPSPPTDPNAAAAITSLGLPAGSSASDIYAAITQQQWQQYLSTFVPIENQLIQYATDPTQVTQSMDAARTDVQQAQATQAGSTQRELAGLGVTLNPAQQAASTRETGVSNALASVQAQNTARDLTIQRQQSILGNPAPTAAGIAQQAALLGS